MKTFVTVPTLLELTICKYVICDINMSQASSGVYLRPLTTLLTLSFERFFIKTHKSKDININQCTCGPVFSHEYVRLGLELKRGWGCQDLQGWWLLCSELCAVVYFTYLIHYLGLSSYLSMYSFMYTIYLFKLCIYTIMYLQVSLYLSMYSFIYTIYCFYTLFILSMYLYLSLYLWHCQTKLCRLPVKMRYLGSTHTGPGDFACKLSLAKREGQFLRYQIQLTFQFKASNSY